MKISAKSIVAVVVFAASVSGATLVAADSFQPHMQSALADLQAAKGELQAAEADKGGYRVKALALVNQAITDTQAGIAVGSGM
jgi:hypothetical protein